MRIKNKQQGSFGLGGEFQDSRDAEKRQQLFRQNKQVGQEVQGTVLRLRGEKAPGQAWLDVGGLALSAQLPFEAQPGQRLLLRIESLEPEIILKFLKQVHGSPAALQVQAYTALRNQMHRAWEDFWHNCLAIKEEVCELVKFVTPCPSSESENLNNSLCNNSPAKFFNKLVELEGFKQLLAWENITTLIATGKAPENLGSINPTHTGGAGHVMSLERCSEPVEAGASQTELLQAENGLVLGEPFPAWLVSVGENLVCNLHKIWAEKFMSNLPNQAQKELAELNSTQLSTVKSLASKGVRAWSQIPWSSPHGSQRELLILRPQGQKLEQVFISGMWPGLGGVLISAMALNGQISCRVQVQNLLPLEQVVQIINLPGIGKMIKLIATKYNLHSENLGENGNLNSQKTEQEQNKIICLELKQSPPDTVVGILLRL